MWWTVSERSGNLFVVERADALSSTPPRESRQTFRWSWELFQTCLILKTTKEFTSKTTGKRFTIKMHALCKTSNIVYLIECRRCGLQYVGESGQPLHKRMNGHRFDITHGRIEVSPVATHFNSAGHSEVDLSVCVVDRRWTEDVILRKNHESKWIRTLGTMLQGNEFAIGCSLTSLLNHTQSYYHHASRRSSIRGMPPI